MTDLERRDQLDLEQHRVDFVVGHLRVTSAGVREFDVRATYEDVLDAAQVASAFIDTGKWVLGDVLNFAEARDWSYDQIAAETGRSIGGLMNIKSVCNRVPYDVRRPRLAWAVHEAVAKLDRAGQIAMLDRVEREQLSVEELRGLLRDGPNEGSLGPSSSGKSEAVIETPSAPSSAPKPKPNAEIMPAAVEPLRDVARAISNTALPEGDCICIAPDLLDRLRRALGEPQE